MMNVARNILTAVSLLLCLLLIALWGRSTAGDDRIGFTRVNPDQSDATYKLQSGAGSIGVFLAKGGPHYVDGFAAGWYPEASLAPNTSQTVPPGFLGFRYVSH